MFKINSRKLTEQEATLLVENIKLITEITGYSLKEWLTFESVLVAEDREENMLGVCLAYDFSSVSYTHLRAHETVLDLVCRLLLEKKKTQLST